MKRSIFLSLLMLCVAGVYADPVSKEQASLKANAFMVGKGLGDKENLSLAYQGSQRSVGKGVPVKDSYYYVFNRGEGKGFVIVSGDDCTEDILGYSDSGSFDAANIPSNLREWLEGYEAEIDWARSADEQTLAKAKIAKASESANQAYPAVEPLLKTHWHQHEPFNAKCYTKSGYKAVVGCVGVALAQVLNYHKWPTASTSIIPSYSGYSALSATTFNWSKIRENYTYSGKESSAEIDALARLMLYSARAVQSAFGTESTLGYTGRIPEALTSYFGYSNSVAELMRIKFDNETWRNILLEELTSGRPIIYSGDRYTETGHAWVIDGYDGGEMFHCNWGWGGQADGYFLLSAFNPYVRGAIGTTIGTYSYNQRAIVGISPTEVKMSAAAAESGILTRDLYLTDSSNKARLASGTYTLNAKNGLSSVYMYYSYRKNGIHNAYDVGVGLFKGDKLLGVRQIHTDYALGTSYWTGKWFWLTGLGVGLANGTYTVKGVDRVSGTEDWVPSDGSNDYYLSLTVKNGTVTIKTVNDTSLSTLKVTKAVQNFEESSNTKHMTFTIKNTGSKPYNSTIYFYVDNGLRTGETAYIGPGEEKQVDFFFNASAGSHVIKLTNGKTSIYSATHTLTDTSTLPALTTVSQSVKNIEGNIMYGRMIDCSITLKNPTKVNYNYDMNVTLGVNSVTEGSYYLEYNTTIPVSVPAGKTVTVDYKYMLSVGDMFYLRIYDPNNTYVDMGRSNRITVAPAIVTWYADGERKAVAPTNSFTVPSNAVAVSFEEISNLSSVTIKPNSNPNTIYYIDRNASIPTAIKSKNVVNEYKAATITLNGAYDYYVPQAFTATKITYTVTPQTAYDGKSGWKGIVLPFAVQGVTAASKTVNWCRGASDTDKDFLIKEFVGDNGSGVEFANASAWIAGNPYIMAVPQALVGKKFIFSATNTNVTSTISNVVKSKNYEFVGITGTKKVTNAYVLNSTGSAFVLSSSANLKGGSTYFVPTLVSASRPNSLSIAGGEVPIVIGDYDGDGEVTVSDISSLVNIINNGIPASDTEVHQVFDTNKDGEITVTDVMILVGTVMQDNN